MSNFLASQIAALLDPTTRKLAGFKGPDGTEFLIPGMTNGLASPNGDVGVYSADPSPWRMGSWAVASGALHTLVGDIVMFYFSHNVAINPATGDFMGRDDAGPCSLFVYTEGLAGGAPLVTRYDAVTGAAGSQPTFTVSSYDGPSRLQVVNNNAAAGLTMAAGKNHIACTGTNATSVAFTLPAIATVTDGFVASIHTEAAISVAATFASTGGTFVNAPATMTAGQVVRFIKSGTTWLPF